MNLPLKIPLMIAALFVAACEQDASIDTRPEEQVPVENPPKAEDTPVPDPKDPSAPEAGVFSFNGTVSFMDLEGGFFVIKADDGTVYDPVNLRKELQVDGLYVAVRARLLEDVANFHMSGPIIEIVKIKML